MADQSSFEPGAGSGGGGVPTSREIATTSPLTGGGTLLSDLTLGIDTSGLVLTSRTVSAGSGLTGGGDLSANRTLSLDATAVVAPSRTIAAGTNLSGGGDLSTNRTISHAASGVTANTYPSPSSVTVDAQGHVTAITAGSGGGGSFWLGGGFAYASYGSGPWALADHHVGVGYPPWGSGTADIALREVRGTKPATLYAAGYGTSGTLVLEVRRARPGPGAAWATIATLTVAMPSNDYWADSVAIDPDDLQDGDWITVNNINEVQTSLIWRMNT